jgi:hypothetical protein
LFIEYIAGADSSDEGGNWTVVVNNRNRSSPRLRPVANALPSWADIVRGTVDQPCPPLTRANVSLHCAPSFVSIPLAPPPSSVPAVVDLVHTSEEEVESNTSSEEIESSSSEDSIASDVSYSCSSSSSESASSNSSDSDTKPKKKKQKATKKPTLLKSFHGNTVTVRELREQAATRTDPGIDLAVVDVDANVVVGSDQWIAACYTPARWDQYMYT